MSLLEVDVSPTSKYCRVRRQIEVHLLGAHVCLTQVRKGERKCSPVWITWLTRERPHAAICGVLWGRQFRFNLALWPREKFDDSPAS